MKVCAFNRAPSKAQLDRAVYFRANAPSDRSPTTQSAPAGQHDAGELLPLHACRRRSRAHGGCRKDRPTSCDWGSLIHRSFIDPPRPRSNGPGGFGEGPVGEERHRATAKSPGYRCLRSSLRPATASRAGWRATLAGAQKVRIWRCAWS